MIEVGIDVLNPIQWRCKGMDREGLKREFEAEVILHERGGDVRDRVRVWAGANGCCRTENIAKVQRLTALAGGLGLEMSQLALAWILRWSEVSAVITGATKPGHFLSNVRAAGVKLTPDVVEEIEGILRNAPARG